jgi:hypothetical protein
MVSMGLLTKLFGSKRDELEFPPVPEWKPDISLPQEVIAERFVYYTDGKKDFVIFRHGTCVIVNDNLSDSDASAQARDILREIFSFHLDMNPVDMDDGNILVRYSHPAFNIVLDEIASTHWETIKANHLRALARDEVLITPLGPNKFDDFGMKALFGRCYFFMDAKKPQVSRIVRKTM